MTKEAEARDEAATAAGQQMGQVLTHAAAAVEGNSTDDGQQRNDRPMPSVSAEAEPVDDSEPPPAYGEEYGHIVNNDAALGLDSQATVTQDGRINININSRSRRLSQVFAPALQSQLKQQLEEQQPLPPPYIPPSLGGEPGQQPPPPLNVVIHVVGSRGDVQPFVALGKVLKETYGHRVRLATHPVFHDFVLENGLEFFSIGGDPAELMAFMVKNPGLMPGFDTVRSGDVGKRRKEIGTMIKGCWRSCIETGDGTGVEVSDDSFEDWMNLSSDTSAPQRPHLMRPFIADAIIANPPSFAHIHCAEKLGCPLHIMFTMPYSPTQAFPHPLANIQSSNAETSITNFLSYAMVDLMTFQGLGDIINRFRMNTLGLGTMSLMWAPGMLARLRIPHTYCWSPALIPKPKDWGNHISISGFYFLALASNYQAADDLARFLDAGPPPVYIGFGSIVVDDPTAMTTMVFEAIRKSGQRALVSKGWGGMGADELGIPEDVMMLGNVPHDWLFERVSCVVHHGGAGTTAAGIAAGKPTVVVPFFGDQPFWGAMVHKAGAGPEPIPYKELTADKLAAQLEYALRSSTHERAKELSASIHHENGCQTGAQSFHQQMDVDTMRCSLAPSRAAVWRLKRTKVRLSALAAAVLGNEGHLDFKDLKLYRWKEYDTDTGPSDPITGASSALIGTASSIMMGFADFPVETLKALRVHPDTKKPKKDNPTSDPSSSSPSATQTPAASSTDLSKDQGAVANASSSGSSRDGRGETPSAAPENQPFNVQESLAQLHASTSADSDDSRQGRSMRLALRDQLNDEFVRRTSDQQAESRHRSRSSSRSRTPTRAKFSPDTIMGTGKGVGRILDASFRSPMDFTHALAKGFHNAPKLYGDDTVRKADPITDFRSGIMAAGKEFGYGFYDGITGLVTQPLKGAKKEGAAGFIKGFGKGIGGIMLKPSAAIWGVAGYTMKGAYKELQSQFGSSVQNYIIAARTAQGFEDWNLSSHEERSDIVQRWAVMKETLKKKKNFDEKVMEWSSEHMRRESAPHPKRVERRRKFGEYLDKTDIGGLLSRYRSDTAIEPQRRNTIGPSAVTGTAGQLTPSDTDVLTPASSIDDEGPGLSHASTFPEARPHARSRQQQGDSLSVSAQMGHDSHGHDEEIEEAIRQSLADHSTGNPEEDAMMHRALRASALQFEQHELESAHTEEEEERAMRAALEASLAEAQRIRQSNNGGRKTDVASSAAPASSEKAAITSATAQSGDHDGGEEALLAKAIQQSLQEHEGSQKERNEEEIVLEYVKKQSLLEEEHRKKVTGQGESGGRDIASGEGSSKGA